MRLTYDIGAIRNFKSDAIVVFFLENKSDFQEELNSVKKFLGKRIDEIVKLEDFHGKEGELCDVLTDHKLVSPRLFLVGLGEPKKLSLESYRRGAAAAAKKARSVKVKALAFKMPRPIDGEKAFQATDIQIAGALSEGAILSLYKFDKYFTEKKNKAHRVSQIAFIGASREHQKEIRHALAETKILCEAVYFARDLGNEPSGKMYPESLAAVAKKSAEQYGYHVTAWDKKRIEDTGFGGLVAVNAGSTRPPRFLILEHNAGKSDLETVVLVGKGITFDSGGISIKPSNGMAEMKMDMSGAAAVLATVEAAARLKIPVHLVGLIPATENMPSGSAMKPGDIIVHYGGTTSEVDNTDAEGRLILADALAYAEKFAPKAVIDLATLTGACVVALGSHATGMMGNDEELMAKIKAAGEKSFERVWQLPLFEEYEKLIKSDVADVKNTGGRWAGAITAGLFLKKFVGDAKWTHLDIAGTAILEEDLPYAPKGGSGVGVRLLIELLKNWNG